MFATPRLVTATSDLHALCADWERVDLLCLDTEFVRTRTFYARLGLVQVADAAGVYLLDAVELGDLEPFGEVLASDTSRKVLHSCGEDMGVFLHQFGALPSGVFDTQVAAAMVGLGFCLSYQALVDRILGVHVEKGETRSNWTARPLRPAQLGYAAQDVLHLEAIHDHLLGELEDLGRLAWADEEFAKLSSPARYVVEPEEAFLRVKGQGGLDHRGQGILRLLCAWREGEARDRDLARGFVVRDEALLAVAAKRPSSRRDLRSVPQLGGNERKRYGDTFLELVARGLAIPSDELPTRAPRGPKVPRLAELVRELQQLVTTIASELRIAPEVLAQRRVLESLVRSYAGRGSRELPAELEGWRCDVVGRPALQLLDSVT